MRAIASVKIVDIGVGIMLQTVAVSNAMNGDDCEGKAVDFLYIILYIGAAISTKGEYCALRKISKLNGINAGSQTNSPPAPPICAPFPAGLLLSLVLANPLRTTD